MIKGKRVLVYIVLFLVLLNICTSCNSSQSTVDSSEELTLKKDNEESKQPNDDKSAQKENEAEDLERRKGMTPLRLYLYGTKPEDFDKVARELEKKSGLGIYLDFTWYRDTEYITKFKSAIESGKIDAFSTRHRDLTTIKKLYAEGDIKDITELLPKYAPAIYNQLEDNDLLDNIKIEDRIVMLPTLSNGVNKLLINIDWEYVDKYNITSIETIDDYIKILMKIKNDEDKFKPVLVNKWLLGTAVCIAHDYYRFYEDLVYKKSDTDMKLMAIENVPEYKKIAMSFSEAFRKGVFTDDLEYYANYSTIYTSEHILKDPSENTLVFSPNAIPNYSSKKEEQTLVSPNPQCTFALYPGKDYQKTGIDSNSLVFTNTNKNAEVLLKFLNWINTDQEAYELFNYGLENKHYKYEDGELKIVKDFNIDRFLFNNEKYNRVTSVSKMYDMRNIKNEELSKYAPHSGFDYTYLPSGARGKLTYEYFWRPVKSGLLDNDRYNQAIKDMEEKGKSKAIIDKYQKALNAWRGY